MYHVDLELKKPVILKCQWRQTKKSLLLQGTEKRAAEQNRKLSDNYHCTPAKNPERKLWPIPTHNITGQIGNLSFHSLQVTMSCLNTTYLLATTPAERVISRARFSFLPDGSKIPLPHHTVSIETTWKVWAPTPTTL